MTNRAFIGWKLDVEQREALLARFPPRYATTVADHVTLALGHELELPTETEGLVVGEADDGQGVQALVVAVAGTTDRPDGSTYHVTWSLADGREARESNDVIRERGWRRLAEPLAVRLHPSLFGG